MEPIEYQRMFELEDHHWWYQGRLALTMRMLERYKPAPTNGGPLRLLDIGCGTGMFLERLGPEFMPFGLDFSHQALEFTQSRLQTKSSGALRLVQADSQEIPLADASFDMVTAFDIIEHVEGDGKVVSEIHRILRPGGVLMANVPAHPALWGPHDVSLHHKRRYRKREFGALYDQKLWNQLRLTYAFASIFPPAAIIRTARRVLPENPNPQADAKPTVGWLNDLLIKWHHVEAGIIERVGSPMGLSLVTIQQKRGG